MDNHTIDVGNRTAVGKAARPIIERLPAADRDAEAPNELAKSMKSARARISGAMSQQSGDSNNVSAPQKFVQLVGCREPKARSGAGPDAAKL